MFPQDFVNKARDGRELLGRQNALLLHSAGEQLAGDDARQGKAVVRAMLVAWLALSKKSRRS